ncbi:sperm flagellar protein 2 [Chanos chanos]|uniref:Sperm flagellar protein 2 n=1 Tax=Chanos chanos TaxID=29144 RepID=A0A6J2WTJ8_CHACN|nr:sperm flagellar protein 2 [Chanos chanos]
MSDILCRWLNSELRLSKVVDPCSITRDFANGYLIGEILNKYQLQDDFDQFSKSSTANAKLNNFTRIEPTLQLLGIPFDVGTARALIQGEQGAATRLLYQLFVTLQRKKRSGLTGTAMLTMLPAATARLHRLENDIYAEQLKTVVKREADLKMQRIAQRFDKKGQETYSRSLMVELQEEQKREKVFEGMRLKDIDKHRKAQRKQHELMARIQSAVVQIPKPPPNQTTRALEKHQQIHKQQEAKSVRQEIAQFEKTRKRLSPAGCGASAFGSFSPHTLNAEELAHANSAYIQRIRQRLEEDTAAREHREKRRRHTLIEQLRAHEAQEENLREEQLVERLTRLSQQERKIAAQLLQVRQQKEVLRQNRIVREEQYREQRLKNFHEALEREAALARHADLEHAEERQRELELHNKTAAERALQRYRKHSDICKNILEQIVDLATKAGEYRLLTDNLVPVKLMREWKELFFSAKPLYARPALSFSNGVAPEQAEELEKLEILNNQDYEEYVSMTGEWEWPEDEENTTLPLNNNILGHVISRLQDLVSPPKPCTPPPKFPPFTLRACVVGKLFTGKTTCLSRIAQVRGIRVLSDKVLLQEALAAYEAGERSEEERSEEERSEEGEKCEEHCGFPLKDTESAEKESESSSSLRSGLVTQEMLQPETVKQGPVAKLSVRAERGAEVERILRKGEAIPDELLIDIVVDAIRRLPAGAGWILDGFPVSVRQAKLLERALTGTDPDKALQKRRSCRSSLTINRPVPREATPPAPALDLIVFLDMSDEQVLKRAAKHNYEEKISNPNEEVVSPGAQVLPPSDVSTEKQQIQHRIAEFQDTWPKLEKWLSSRQVVLKRVWAEVEEDALCRTVEAVLSDAMTTTGTDKAEDNRAQNAESVEEEETHCKPVKPGSEATDGALGQSRRMSVSKVSAGTCPPEEAPISTPGSANWAYVNEPLPREIPEYLVPHWENVCDAYVSNTRRVMQNLRSERDLIIQHLYNIREDFKHYLRRPDLKQELVCQWQQDYNSLPQDMREDEEAKAELHQRLDELRERLWDICERRREEGRQERTALTGDGWLEDHTHILINHFSTLIQVEVDRFQDTVCVLRDYYYGMYKTVLAENPTEFPCLPLLDLTEDSNHQHKLNSNLSAPLRIPLIQRRPPSTEVGKQRSVLHTEDRVLLDIHQTALNLITNMVSAEAQRREAEENEEAQMERERLQRVSQASAPPPNSAKDKKKSGKKKGALSPAPEPSPAPSLDEDLEDVKKRNIRGRIRQEFAAALQHEEAAMKQRLNLIKKYGLRTVQSVQQRADDAYSRMEDWLDRQYLAEMKSIEQMVEVVQCHIEKGLQLRLELVLVCSDFFMDGDTRMVPSPRPPPPPPPLETPTESTLTIAQLGALYSQLYKVSPSGVVSSTGLCEILKELMCVSLGSDALPEAWKTMSDSQVQELASLLAGDSGVLDWRRFLLSAALPWPIPSVTQLLQTLERFRANDPQNTGFITEDHYLQTELWFPAERVLLVPDEPINLLPYDRLANLRKFFFLLFADHSSVPPKLDYVRMLLYLCSHQEPKQGFIRALSLLTGQALHTHTTSPLLQSVSCIEDQAEGIDEDEDEDEDADAVKAISDATEGVCLDALLTVISHASTKFHDQNRFHASGSGSREDLVRMFGELGFKPDDKIPFSLLYQYPLLQDLMDQSTQYQLTFRNSSFF